MKISLAQMDVVPGNPEKNLSSIKRMSRQVKEGGSDLVAFPEMAVGGYLLGDHWRNDSYCRDLMEYNDNIKEISKELGIAVAYGNVYLDDSINQRVGDAKPHPNKDGTTRKYNAAYMVQNGMPAKRIKETYLLPAGVQPKTLLPNYRFFDDERYFYSLEDIALDFGEDLENLYSPFVIDVEGVSVLIGLELCEDLWCADYRRNLESLNATKFLIKNGAQKIINLSASPWTFGKNDARDRRIRWLKAEAGDDFVTFYYVNCCGAQNNGKNIITFDGGSTIYNSDAQPIRMSSEAYLEEVIEMDDSEISGPVIPRKEKSKVAQKWEAVIRGILHMKDIIRIDHEPSVVVGLSGGIDSSLVASMFTFAYGPENVLGVNMPTRYNSDTTKGVAEHVAKSLGIAYEVLPIENLVEENASLVDSIDPFGEGEKLSEFNLENVQAKIRGAGLLSNIAAKYGAIFSNNGNKLEVATGYFTLDGDGRGAICPIGDLTKTEEIEMAKYVNKDIFKSEIIPESLFPDSLWRFSGNKIQPSAELKQDQVDPFRFGYHCALIEVMTDYMPKSAVDIMNWYLEGTLHDRLNISVELMRRWSIDDPREFIEDLEWFDSSVVRNVFKRVQTAPIIVTSKTAYGYDKRESMLPYTATRAHKRLKEKVLALGWYPG